MGETTLLQLGIAVQREIEWNLEGVIKRWWIFRMINAVWKFMGWLGNDGHKFLPALEGLFDQDWSRIDFERAKNHFEMELMKELNEKIFKEFKELYLFYLSHKVKDEKIMQAEVETVIDSITEETKNDDKPILTWKTQVFLKYLTESSTTGLDPTSKSLKSLFSECCKLYHANFISYLNTSSKSLPQLVAKDFIHSYLTSMFYKIYISDASPDEPILEVLHESYVRIIKFVKNTILWLEERSRCATKELIDKLKENLFLNSILVFSTWMASLYDHDLNIQEYRLCQLLIEIWKEFDEFSHGHDTDVDLKSWIYSTFTLNLEHTLAKIANCLIKIDLSKNKDITQTAINNLFVSNVMSGGLKNKLLLLYFKQQKHIFEI